MIVMLRDVPRRERHLLYCSALQPRRRRHGRKSTKANEPIATLASQADLAPDVVPLAAGFGPAGIIVDNA